MKKYRYFGGRFSRSDKELLSQYNINLDEKDFFSWVEIEDENVYDNVIKELSDEFKDTCLNKESLSNNQNIRFKYSIDDIKNADYCVFNNVLTGGGYPEPSSNFDYMYTTYAGKHCNGCSIPKIQIDNFKVNKVSTKKMWGFTAWEKDVIFVKNSFYENFFKPFGIGYRHINKTRNEILSADVQLELPVIEEYLDLSYNDYMICSCCKEKKYFLNTRYPFFPIHKHPLPYIYLTKEYFGTGHEAGHRIIMSTIIALKLIDLKLIPAYSLIPCRKDLNEYLFSHPELIIPGILNSEYPLCEKNT